jgi:hypothetical protein
MEGVRARRSLDHGDRAPPAVGAMANRHQTIIALALWSGRRAARAVLPRRLAEPATARPVQRALFGIAEQTGDLLSDSAAVLGR